MPDEAKDDIVKTVVTARADGISETTMAKTPAGMPSQLLVALSPVRIVATRVARVYVQSLVGMLGVVMSGMAPESIIAPRDFYGKLSLAAGLALAPSVITLLQNTGELLAKWDTTHPSLRA